MNVALHLCQLGAEVLFISKVGDDKEGKDLLAFIGSFGLDMELVQMDSAHPTGKVIVDDSDKENITYDIVHPAAWDLIEWSANQQEKVDQAEAFVFWEPGNKRRNYPQDPIKATEDEDLKSFGH